MRLLDLFTVVSSRKEQIRHEEPRDNLYAHLVVPGDQVNINENTILGGTGAWRCLKLIGQSIGRVDKLVKKRKGDIWTTDNASPINNILQKPSPYTTAFSFYETLTAFAALYGNGYAYVKRGPDFFPLEFVVLHPNDVTPVYIDSDFYYTVILPNGGMIQVDPVNMLHVSSMAMDKPFITGKNPSSIHRDNFKLGKYAQKYGVGFYENGAHLAGYLHTAEHLTKKESDRIGAEFDSGTQGITNVNRTPVLHSGLEYKHVKLTPKDALFLEVSNMTLGELSRIFGVPMHLLSNLDRATFTNIEQQGFEFQEYTLEPWSYMWQESLTNICVPSKRFNKEKVVFDTRGLRAGDAESRANYYTKMFTIGALSPNEIRAREGDNPRDGGDVYYTQVNVFTDDERDARMNSDYKQQTD